MAKEFRKCVMCGKEYSYCPRCGADADKPKWMFSFDTENCMELMGVLSDYAAGAITAVEANEKLNNLDLSKTYMYSEADRKLIDKIKSESKRATKQVFNKVEEPKAE